MSFRRFFDGGQGRRGVVPYSDPYNDIAQFNLPPSIKALMVLCRRLFLTNSTIYPTIWKISNYPITDLKFEAATQSIRADYSTLYNDVLHVKQFDQLLNLDFNCFGNALASPVFPFDKWVICPDCNREQKAKNARFRFNKDGQFNYIGECPGCKRKERKFIVEDRQVLRAWNRMKLIRWPPLSMDIDHNPYNGESIFYHRIPREVRAMLSAGNHLLASTLPIEFVKASRLGKRVKLTRENVFHMARPSISDTRISFGPWGIPLILPVVKDTYALQILKRSQEAMAQHRILPLRVIWPLQGNQPTAVGGINMGQWRGFVEDMVRMHTRDPNFTGVSPVGLGMGTLGADARPMLLNQEIEALAQQIVVGMGVPKGFVYGDLQFSSASVTLRMMENELISSRVGLTDFNDGFLRGRIQTYMDWPNCKVSFTNMRMADDIQRLQLLQQLNQLGKISDKDFLGEFGYDYEQQSKQRRIELEKELENQKLMSRGQAEAQGIAQMIATRYAHEAQQTMTDLQQQAAELAGLDHDSQLEPTTDQEAVASDMMGHNNTGQGGTFAEMADQHAQEFAGMSPGDQNAQLQAMQTTSPGYANLVKNKSVDMRPMPEQLPPRRGPGNASI